MELKGKLILDSGIKYKYDTEKEYPVFINFERDKLVGTARILKEGEINIKMINDILLYDYWVASYSGWRDGDSFTIDSISLIARQ